MNSPRVIRRSESKEAVSGGSQDFRSSQDGSMRSSRDSITMLKKGKKADYEFLRHLS